MAQFTITDGDVPTADQLNTYAFGEGGAWTSFTPTLRQSGTVASSFTWSRYARFGRLIIWTFAGTATAAGSAGNAITVSLPVTAAPSVNVVVGHGSINDQSVASYTGMWKMQSVTAIGLVRDSATQFVGAAPSFALANTDVIEGFVVFEAAS